MLLEIHIRRVSRKTGKPGTDVRMEDVLYTFAPNPALTNGDEEAHVCEVTDEEHVARFLAIGEAYTKYGEKLTPPAPPPEPVLEEIPEEPTIEDELQVEEDLDIELEMCETIVGMKVSEAKVELTGLSDTALAKLSIMEKAGQARKGLLSAIAEEQENRLYEETDG
jgi:hypothetical protein